MKTMLSPSSSRSPRTLGVILLCVLVPLTPPRATAQADSDPFADPSVIEGAPPSPAPAAAAPDPAAEAPATEPTLPSLLDAIKKASFSRTPQVILDETAAAVLPPPGPAPPPVEGAPPADPHAEAVAALRRAVALGRWDEAGTFFAENFKDQPDQAKQAYEFLLDALAADPRQQPQQQARVSTGTGPPVRAQVQGGSDQFPAFRESQLIHPSDILALAEASPTGLDPTILDKLGRLLRVSVERGERMEAMLEALDKGVAHLGGAEPPKRLLAARLLVAAGQPVHAGRFLPGLDEALASKDAESLNLLSLHFLGQHDKEGQPVWLERAWQATQGALAVPGSDTAQRQEALRRAMDLAPRVQADFGEQWLIESFTTEPARGLEILATIGSVISRDRMHFQAEVRRTNLELQHRVVSTLLHSAPERAVEWRQPLTVLAINWMQEGRWSLERDVSTQRGPQMQYDPFGNVYFSNYDFEQQQMMQQQQRGPGPIPSGSLLDLRPGDAWLDRIEASLRPALLAQTAELFLKVNEPEEAFPLIEEITASLKDEGSRLAGRFIEVWTEKHDPNTSRRRTNRFMYVYGYNPQSDGIPLTRSRQDRNLQELAGWVKRLRALPIDGLDEAKIADAFVKTHSLAEVYRLEAIETVFGSLASMQPETLAALVQRMRTNLGSVWRVPKVQQDANTKRTDKDIQAEILRGYSTALDALEPALFAHPEHWGLRLAHAAVLFDEATYQNSLLKDSSFTAKRDAAFDEFQQAADLYARALPTLQTKDQTAQVYLQWFYASLGACDLEAVKFEYPEAPNQTPLIRDALRAITGEEGEKHLTEFANALSTRISAVQPELKHRYLGAGLQIAGDHERAREAKELYDYYRDIVTEVKLATRIDGSDRIGTAPFGLFVDIRHTGQIEREAGGFQKYLQNQQGGYYYNFGRPPENYRDKFEEAARQALQESFDVLSCTFHTDKILSRGTGEDGWRITPYAYLLLKAKGPQVDALPPLKLNLDFLDTSGFAVLPVDSPRVPVAAAGAADVRPIAQVEIKQILDERKAREGILALEIRATAHGLVPALGELLVLPGGDFELTATGDQGVHVIQLDAEAEENSVVSERLWNLSYRAKRGLATLPKTFTFPTAKNPEFQLSQFRYADADLAAVGPTAELMETYAKPGFPWPWLLAVLATLIAAAGLAVWRRGRKPAVIQPTAFALPSEINPLTVLGLLRRIRERATLPKTQISELDQTIARLEAHHYGAENLPSPDLDQTARHWAGLAS